MKRRFGAGANGWLTGAGVRVWVKRIGVVGIIFFMVKGLAWIVLAMLAGYGFIRS